jgi:large subunit ribosomal protein L25
MRTVHRKASRPLRYSDLSLSSLLYLAKIWRFAILLPMDLIAKQRDVVGKKVRMLRREGLLPAELYGHGLKNLHLAVATKEFNKIFKEAGENTVITLVLAPDEKRSVLVNDVQKNYLTGEIDHIDFYQVRMDEKLTAKVPLEFEGVSLAVREKGGIIAKSMSEIEVEALPNDLPHRITVDLSALDDLNKTIYVRDLHVPKGVTVLVDAETAIVSVTPPMAEEVVEVPVDVSAVKVESEEKKAERVAEKAVMKEE